jgi:glutathione synthase/RimK-type ligase-like ATP-grasp enzyme/gamma-glutamyl:cysteine ligase YbdK (ATP-grasp superfamily)
MAERPIIIVTSKPNDVVPSAGQSCTTAEEYLEGNATCCDPNAQVINLCRDVSYGSEGYYVSLLADARGQEVLPRVQVFTGLSEPYARFRALQEAGAPTIDAAEMVVRWRSVQDGGGAAVALEDRPAGVFPTPLVADPNGGLRVPDPDELVETFIFLGTCSDARFQQAARAIFREWPAPLLRMQIVLEDSVWKISQVAAASPHELNAAQLQELQQALADYRGSRSRQQPRTTTRASIAVLVDPNNQFSPSSPETIDRLERVATRMNVHVARLNLHEMRRLPEYDALFVRCHTSVTNPAFQFALRAEALGMPVVDATTSTIRCTNKVFVQELLNRAGIPTPRSQVLTSKTSWEQIETLGLPFVLKLPDGDFSAAVHKITSREDYDLRSASMFRKSPLLIAQEWLPTTYDWRIGIIGGRLLFAAKYHMAHGHWQIRTVERGTERYGKVEAIKRSQAPHSVVDVALRAAALVGDGFYGVDIKETAAGPVVIEVNDNPNLDIGYEDTQDGDAIYEDIINYFVDRVNTAVEVSTGPEPTLRDMREPIAMPDEPKREYGFFEVAGLELEYPIVDGDLNVKPLVEPAFRILAGRGTSDVDLGAIGFSNEFADHVFELKTQQPLSSFTDIEQLLFEGVQRFTAVLRDEFGARLFPTGMHPWFDPVNARLWTRSGLRVYTTYARLFDVRTHGWMNVQASHVNLPFGTETETVAMHNASALLIPYLPAIAASSPIYDEQLQPAADGRMDFLTRIQSRVPESCGRMVPEYITSFADYRKNILQPMYAAIDRMHDASAIRYEFFNTRAAILRFSRKALEIRVLDTQECVKMDVAIAAFAKYALQHLTNEILAGRMQLPDHDLLVEDFHACIRSGSRANVHAPHLGNAQYKKPVVDVLSEMLAGARTLVPDNEVRYLDLGQRVIETGTLSERIRAELEPAAGKPAAQFREAVRHVYIQLADCLESNEPWERRWR